MSSTNVQRKPAFHSPKNQRFRIFTFFLLFSKTLGDTSNSFVGNLVHLAEICKAVRRSFPRISDREEANSQGRISSVPALLLCGRKADPKCRLIFCRTSEIPPFRLKNSGKPLFRLSPPECRLREGWGREGYRLSSPSIGTSMNSPQDSDRGFRHDGWENSLQSELSQSRSIFAVTKREQSQDTVHFEKARTFRRVPHRKIWTYQGKVSRHFVHQ